MNMIYFYTVFFFLFQCSRFLGHFLVIPTSFNLSLTGGCHCVKKSQVISYFHFYQSSKLINWQVATLLPVLKSLKSLPVALSSSLLNKNCSECTNLTNPVLTRVSTTLLETSYIYLTAE